MSCFNCGSALPEGARFCPSCGAPVEGAAASPLRSGTSWEVCEIGCWRGYLKAEFYARRRGENGEELARSPGFRWSGGNSLPNDGKALVAHEALVAKLRDEGWEPVGQARPWYAQRFRRAIAGIYELPAEPPPAEELAP